MKHIRGSFTIEAAIIVPLILFIFGNLLHILFYWHDKNILMSTAHETTAIGSSRSEMSESEIEYYFFSRIKGKLLLFDRVQCRSYIEDEKVTIEWDGSKRALKTRGKYSMKKTDPENYIREIRKLKKLGEGMVREE